ncbi:MAG: DUF2333 family protein [Alphaproteobacteria bacterium]|nr:DUF2333 family protein [Alphaproteobacteria bacterium]
MADSSVPSDSSGPGETPTPKPETPPERPSTATASTPPARRGWLSLKMIGLVPLALIVLVIVYYIGGMLWLTKVDDDVAFGMPSTAPDGGSATVAMATDLIERETETHRWIANDPFFMPGYMLDNMPNFQQGIMTALFRFTSELRDEIARTRGSSSEDPDAKAAAGYLSYPPDVWIYDPKVSWWTPTAPSEKQYGQGMRSLRQYNQRVADGEARFEARSDNLQTLIDRFTSDIGSASATISRHIEEKATAWLDFQADDLFYANKGRLYAYYLLMRAMQEDFGDVIQEKGVGNAWRLTLKSLEEAATLQPWVVTNGSPDSQFRPSHLAAQGFYLLRARTQLKEISNILLK